MAYAAPTMCGRHQVFFALDFEKHSITLTYCNELVGPVLLECLNSVIDAEVYERFGNVLIIKTHPHVFRHGPSDAVFLREKVMCTVFEEFLRHGWRARVFSNLQHTSKRYCAVFEITDDCLKDPLIVALCMKAPKKLLLQNGNSELANALQDAIMSTWPRGITYLHCESPSECKIRLSGDPWGSKYWPEMMGGRLLIADIINRLHKLGYSFYVSGHPGSSTMAADTIYFLKQGNDERAPLGAMSVLGLWGSHRLYLLNSRPNIISLVSNCIESVWKLDGEIFDESMYGEKSSDVCIFELKGKPWTASGEAGMAARFLLLRILEELRINGFRLHCSLNLMHRLDDVGTFILTEDKPVALSYSSMSFHRCKAIRFVNVQDEIVEEIRKKVASMLNSFDDVEMDEGEYYDEQFPQIYLGCNFLSCIGALLIILEKMEAMGCTLVASTDLSARSYSSDESHYPIGYDTWFFETKIETERSSESAGAIGCTPTKS